MSWIANSFPITILVFYRVPQDIFLRYITIGCWCLIIFSWNELAFQNCFDWVSNTSYDGFFLKWNVLHNFRSELFIGNQRWFQDGPGGVNVWAGSYSSHLTKFFFSFYRVQTISSTPLIPTGPKKTTEIDFVLRSSPGNGKLLMVVNNGSLKLRSMRCGRCLRITLGLDSLP